MNHVATWPEIKVIETSVSLHHSPSFILFISPTRKALSSANGSTGYNVYDIYFNLAFHHACISQ